MKDLALKVVHLHRVEFRQPQRANACGRQIETHRTAQSAHSHDQHSSRLQSFLPLYADLRQNNLSAVPRKFFGLHSSHSNNRTAGVKEAARGRTGCGMSESPSKRSEMLVSAVEVCLLLRSSIRSHEAAGNPAFKRFVMWPFTMPE